MNHFDTDTPLRTAAPFSGWVGYAVAVAAVAVATLVRLALDPALGNNHQFITYFLAVAAVAWFGRTPHAVVTLVVGAVVACYLFVPPRYAFAPTDPDVLLVMGLFLVVGGVVVAMSHTMRRAASAAADQQERLRITLASIGDAVISTDRDGNVTYLNAVAEALTGWTNAEAAGVPLPQVFRIVNEATRLPVENPAAKALREGVVVGLAKHTVLISRDGTERPIDDSDAPIRDKDGEIVGSVLVFRDISDRKKAEAEQREARQQIDTTLESVTDGFMRYDRDWRIVYVNAEAERINRLTRSEMIGQIVWEVFPAVVGTKLEAEYRRAVAEQVTVEFENHYEPFGRWYSLKGYPTADGGLTTFIRDITEHKRAEQRLAESEARYRAIGESIDYGVWVCDATGRNTYASDSFLRMVGITQQQCSDFGWGAVLHPDDAEATIAAWKECVQTQGTWDKVHRFKGVDGRLHHVLARGVPLRDATGRNLGWAGINLDISRIVEAEQEIARVAGEADRQRRLYETVLTNTPDFVYVFSLDHKVVYANDALIKMWGRSYEGAIGKTFLEIGYESWHAQMHDREIDQVRATKQPIRGEVPFNGTHGRRICDYIFVPVLGADGEVEAVAGTTRDVTERKETERRLRDGQEQLDFALAAADLGQWSLNLADHTTRRTLRHDQLFGYDALLPEWTYEMFLEHVVPDDRAAVDATFQEAVATGSAWAVECRIRRADGLMRHIWTKALIRRDADGQVAWMLGIVGDVTDRRQAEARQAYLVRLADTLRPLSDAIDVQAQASQVLGEHLGANRVVYFEIRDDDYVIERDYSSGVASLVGRYPVADFGPDELTALLEGRTVVETDATTEPNRPPDERAAFAAIQVLAHVDVPLVKGGRFVAGMTVQISQPREWTREEVALIEETAERTWAAVERVRAEAALRQSEERLRMALHAARMVAWEYDPASGVVFTSDNASDVYGFPEGEGMGTIDRGFAILHPDDIGRHQAAVTAAVASGEGYISQFRIIRPDNGAVQWMEERGHAVRDSADGSVRLVGVNMDITARKQAEEALQASEEKYRTLFTSMDEGFCVIAMEFDPVGRAIDYRIEVMNPAFEKHTGMSGLVGKSIREALPDLEQFWYDTYGRVAATGEPNRFVYQATPMANRWFDVYACRLGGEGNNRVAVLFNDVSARKQAETQLKASEEQNRYLLTLADVLRSISDPTETQAQACRVLGEHLGANRVAYFEVDGNEYVVGRDYTDAVQSMSGRFPIATFGPKLFATFLAGRTAIDEDVNANLSLPLGEREAFAASKIGAYVGVPLVNGSVLVGGMGVHSSAPRTWTATEIAIIEATAERTWAAVEEARAEAALRASEERAAFVRRSTGVGFWYCDLPFDVFQWDELVKAHFHLPPDATVTIQTFFDRIHPEDREPIRQAIERSIADRTPYNEEYRTVDPGTRAVTWVRAIGRTFYAADGTPTRFDGVTLDVSYRKQAEQALRDSETYFRSMADTSPSMLWVTDLTGQCTYISQQWCEYTGTSLEQNMGLGWLECIHPDDRQRAGDIFQESNRQGRSFAFDYRLRRHDGEYRWAMDAGQPRFDVTGRFIGYIGTVSDIHDRKRAEEELKDADRRKDVFLATLAHELRNPLAPIRNGLQVIRLAGANGTVEQARSMMDRQLTQLVRLVDDLLDVSRVTSGKLELRKERIELKAVIDAAVETSRPAIEQAGHDFAVVVPDEPIFVDADVTRLAQVVSNLLNNSAKYTHRGGHVRLAVGHEDGTAMVAVKDTGIGIPPAMLDKVFEMFTQVDRTLEKTTGGLGIGLSLVKGLVEMHGGTIAAKSEGEGRGSEFVVRLPVAAPAPSDGSDERVEDITPSGLRRILVVDDNVDSADSLAQLLELLGNEVRTAYDGEAGVRAAGEFRPAVVLCDLGMPVLNGYEAARRIRAEMWGKDMVLVALTGWGQEDDRKKSADAGFDFHLVKPVDTDALMKLLAGLQTAPA